MAKQSSNAGESKASASKEAPSVRQSEDKSGLKTSSAVDKSSNSQTRNLDSKLRGVAEKDSSAVNYTSFAPDATQPQLSKEQYSQEDDNYTDPSDSMEIKNHRVSASLEKVKTNLNQEALDQGGIVINNPSDSQATSIPSGVQLDLNAMQSSSTYHHNMGLQSQFTIKSVEHKQINSNLAKAARPAAASATQQKSAAPLKTEEIEEEDNYENDDFD